MSVTLVIGNKNYSSWSLRSWLLLRHFGVPFHEQRIPLSTPETAAQLLAISPAARVPVLLDGDLRVWDSLAIGEYVSEQYLGGRGWPQETSARAHARSLAAEMHAGFQALRNAWPMNIRLQRKLEPAPEVADCIKRIDSMWSDCLAQHGGPWLFGEFSIADAMYAPGGLRFHSYQPQLSAAAARYGQVMLAHPALQEWMDAARAEVEIIEEEEIDFLAQKP